jgi:FkbM family methyltransferase
MDTDLILNKEIDFDWILKDAKPKGVIHVGAYIGGCLKLYQDNGVKNRCWIEACPDTFEKLWHNIPLEDVALNVAVTDMDEEILFHITSNGQSSSLLPLKNHSLRYPTITETDSVLVQGMRMDTLVANRMIDMSKYNFLLMDIQGGEYFALKGFKKNLKYIDYIVSEISYEELYEGCMCVCDFDEYLHALGFEKIMATQFVNFGWGDAYYKRV